MSDKRHANIETNTVDSEGRTWATVHEYRVGVGEATLLQRAIEESGDPRIQWIADLIGRTDSMDLDINITRRWNC